MNTTIGIGILNNTLRIAMYCGAFNLWFEPYCSAKGVAWHGWPAWDFANMKAKIGLEYKVLTELPEPRNNLYSDMLALMDGVADISIDQWHLTYERSLLVDFSYPRSFQGIHIFSGARKGFTHADLVMGIYDDMSFRLIVITLVVMIITSWLLLRMEGRNCSLLTCSLYIFENAMYKSLNPVIVPSSIHKRSIITIFTIYNFAINLMYMSIIISLLVSGSKPPQINSLADLRRDEFEHVRILLRKQGPFRSYLKSARMLGDLEHRVDFFETAEAFKPYILQKVLSGSHVFISSHENLHKMMCESNKDSNNTVLELEDFRQSRQGFCPFCASQLHIADANVLNFTETQCFQQERHIFIGKVINTQKRLTMSSCGFMHLASTH